MAENYFRIISLDDGNQISIKAVGSLDAVNLQYRTSIAQTWQAYAIGTLISISTNEWIEFRNDTGTFSSNISDNYNVTMTKAANASGSIMSLLNYNNMDMDVPIFAFCGLFRDCTTLREPPALPATTLAVNCYASMFEGCSSLQTAPQLPATTLANSCYTGMFYGCSSLQTAPELPATTLAVDCYASMFGGCPKIDRIVWKSTQIPSSTYCSGWLEGVSASGKFEYTEPTLDVASITRDSSGVPAGWSISMLSPETKLLLKINNSSVDNISLFGKKIVSLSINGKNVKSSSAA